MSYYRLWKGQKIIRQKFKIKDGVQCEACHGPGQKYGKKKEKKKLVKLKRALSKATEGSGDYQIISSDLATERIWLGIIGLIMASENNCKTCHVPERKFQGKLYKSPTWDKHKFEYEKFRKKISHPRTIY